MGRRKLGGRGKKGRVFARARGGICIYTQARARVCKIENGKSGYGEGKRAKGPPRKPALDRSSGAVGRKLRLKGKWRATGPER